MSTDDVWEKFLPKLRRGNVNSSLSQISTNSSFLREGRMSLSCHVSTHNLSQAAEIPSRSEISLQKTPTSSRSSRRRTTISSTRKKVTPKNKSPSDGLQQKSLDCYFSKSIKQSETPKGSTISVIQLDSDSSGDEDSSKTIRTEREKRCQHEQVKSLGISRVLFSSTADNAGAESVQEASKSDAKKKQNASIAKNSQVESVVEPSAECVFNAHLGFKHKEATRCNLGATRNVNHTTVICDRAQETEIDEVVLISMVDKEQENRERNLGVLKTVVDGAGSSPNSIVKTVLTSSRFTGCDKPVSNLERDSAKQALAVDDPKGKKKVNIQETLLMNSGPVVNSKKHHSFTTRKDDHCDNTSDLYNDDREVTHQQSLTAGKATSVNEVVENFTGVTECVILESSGEVWTPKQNSRSSFSSDSDWHLSIKKAEHSNNDQQLDANHNRMGKNIENSRNSGEGVQRRSRSISKRGKGKVYEEIEGTSLKPNYDKSIKETTNKITPKNDGKIRKGQNIVDSGHTHLDNELDKDRCNNPEQSSLTLSGGFFLEDENLEKSFGHAFDIKSPSNESLEKWGSIMDESYVVEEKGASGSEISSVLADLSTIRQFYNDSVASTETSQTAIADQGNETNMENGSAYSASTIIPSKKLIGVSLSTSEWDKLPTQQVSKESDDTVTSLDDGQAGEHLTGSSYVSWFKGNSQNISQSIKGAAINNNLGTSQKLNIVRATSPHEAQEAPSDVDMNVGSSHKALQPGISLENSSISTAFSSISTEIRISSAIAPVNHPQTIQELSPDTKDSTQKIYTSERVHEWVSQIHRKASINGVTTLGSSEVSREDCNKDVNTENNPAHKENSNQALQIIAANPVLNHSMSVSEKTGNKCKPCDVICQVKLFINSSFMNDTVLQNVNKTNCCKNNIYDSKKTLNFNKTMASLTVEVFEIPDNVSSLHKGLHVKSNQREKSHGKNNTKTGNHISLEELDRNSDDCIAAQKFTIRPVKVEVKYGRRGWEELVIDCDQEDIRNGRSFTVNSSRRGQVMPTFLCIQKVDIKICNCSRLLQVNCIVSKVEVESNSVHRSRFHTSLKDYGSHLGLPESPVTLSMIAYPEFSTSPSSFGPNSEENVPQVIECMDVNPLILNRSESFQRDSSRKKSKTDSTQTQEEKERKKTHQKIQKNVSSSLSYSEDEPGTPSGFSDDFREWMTPPHEQEEVVEKNAVEQWKDLMKIMKNGSNTLNKSSDITPTSSSASSVCSATSGEKWIPRGCRGRTGYAKERNSRVCPFYKLILGTKFAVDAFSYGSIPGITHYFLSHFHYDHYMGLKKNFSHPIYCSSVTAKLVALKIKVDQSLLKRLDPGQTVTVSNTKVTALDANHCPGSLMLLFELPGGKTHLHVGDFRAHPCMESYHALWNVDVDRLYLDTTYCDPTYTFPSQEEVIGNVLSIVDSAIAKESKTLIVCGSYTIGKERVFAAVAKSLGAKIWAPADKRKVLECVKEGLQDLLTVSKEFPGAIEGGAGRELGLEKALSLLTNVKEEAQVHVLPMARLKKECLEDHLYSVKGSNFTNVVAFRPTGWAQRWSNGGRGGKPVCNSSSVKIYEVAYSEHSSFLEMERFVKFIRPKQVVKTVNVATSHQRQAMDKYINSWLEEVRSKMPIPNKNNDSPKTSQAIEEQRKAGVFLPKNGNNFVERKKNRFPNSFTPLTSNWQSFVDENGESAPDSLETIVLSPPALASESQTENRTDLSSLKPGVALKRPHSFNTSGTCFKKRLS